MAINGITENVGSEDRMLKIGDLKELHKEYFKYRASWYNIGLELGIDESDLEAIKKDNFHVSEDCFCAMLKVWLRKDAHTRRVKKDLDKAMNQINRDKAASLYRLAKIGLLILFALWSAYVGESAINKAAGILCGIYEESDVVQFDLLRSQAASHNMPFLDVIMKNRHGDEIAVNELLLNYTGQPGHLLITGQPGSGKTTFMRHLAKEWAEGRVLSSCQILFLIYLGRLNQNVGLNSLTSLLRASPYEDLDYVSISEEIRMNHGAGACFLLDAYDEWKSDTKNYVHDMIFQNVLHSSLIISTSRSFNEFNSEVDFQIVGFPFIQLNSYLHEISNDTKLIRSVEELWKGNRKIKEMCTLPLHMAMVLFVTKHGVTITPHVTTTRIYLAFMNATIIHYPEMYNEDCTTDFFWRCINSPHDHRELCTAFQYLHKIAFRMRLKNEVAFEKNSSIQRSINKLGFVGTVLVNGSETVGKIVSKKVKFLFSHLTFLDFFAALHLTSLTRDEQLIYIMLYQDDYKFHMLWKFYFGLIGDVYRHNVSFVSPFVKQYSAYTVYSKGELLDVCSTFIHSQKYLMTREIGWSDKVYRELLESAELVVNSTLCIQCTYAYDEYGRHSTPHCPPNIQLSNWNLFVLLDLVTGWVLLKNTPDQTLNEEYIWKLFFCMHHGFNNSSCTEVNFSPVHSIRLRRVENGDDIHRLNNMIEVSPNLEFIQVDFDLVTYTKKRIPFDILNWTHSKHAVVGMKPIILGLLLIFENTRVSELTLNYHRVSRIFSDHYKIRSPLYQVLKEPSALHSLSIRDLCYTEPTLDMLLSGLKGLHYLSIHSCHLHGTDIEAIIQSFDSNDYLFVFELKQEWSSDLNVIFKHLPYGLKELHTSKSLLDTDVAMLSRKLGVLYDLTTLTLKNNNITGVGIESLAKGLKSLQFFYSLDLSGNPIRECENGIAELAQLSTLESLSITLSSNNDIQLLVDALLANKNLHTLVLSLEDGSDITPLARLKNLKHLTLSIYYDLYVDKNLVLNIVENLTQLKTLELISNCDGWSEEDIFEVTLKAFQHSLEGGHICDRRRSRHYFEPAPTDSYSVDVNL